MRIGNRSGFILGSALLVVGLTLGQMSARLPAAVTLTVDGGAVQGVINPHIYGLNFADEALAADLQLLVNRWGGNATTRYNWQNDTSNRASDWYFENIPNDNSAPHLLPDSASSNQWIDQNVRTGTDSILTVPLIGWTPKSREYACGFSVSKYGAQAATDPWRPDCGNGLLPDWTTPITGNAPTDTSAPIDEMFVQDWMAHLIGRYGTAAAGGVRFYNLDNEPMLWNHTHRDVHPQAVGYDELRDLTVQYAAAIKAADSAAQTLGPVVWGWTAYFYSAKDQEPGGAWWNNPQDRNAHGGVPLVPWYLQQLAAYEQAHGVRILDYLDLHYYPQASGVALSAAGDAATQARRLRATRSLWDSTYVDESWINEPVQLIPRMRDWVDTNYPGTKLAITEYNFGGHEHINGALAQAEVLGIFGREGVDLATLWDPPTFDQPAAFAFRMYRNVDGAGGQFGNLSLAASSSAPDTLSIFAAQRSTDLAMTLMVVNKTAVSQTANVQLSGFTPDLTAAVYQYSAQDTSQIVTLPAQPVTASGFTAVVPANSITLFVLPPAGDSYWNYLPAVVSDSE